MSKSCSIAGVIAALIASLAWPVIGQSQSRISGAVDEGQLKLLGKNTHPLARSEFDAGAAPADLAMDRMLLVLSPSSTQKTALEQLLKDQQDPSSPRYHKWLTPEQFGEQFGASEADLGKVTAWLASHGMAVKRVANGRNIVEFSGTASQVGNAFHTEIRKYLVAGRSHWANANDPQIPSALAPVVAGVATLHNFRKAPQIARVEARAARMTMGSPSPQFTNSKGQHALAPADFDTIYQVTGVHQAGTTGAGVTIAVVGRSDINLSDVASFRNVFELPNNPPQIVLNGSDPGLVSGDESEAVLDTSWTGALAPQATIELVVSASTNTTDGVDLSEEYIVDNNLADVMTESYGDCEANYTQTEAQFYSALAAQAAAEGITYTVAAGDNGAEGCDDPNSEVVASGPVSVNILAATPYNIAVGGTQFNESAVSGVTYWSTTTANDGSSAERYIPEDVWNESCLVSACGANDAGIWAGSGGASTLFKKPSWQAGVTGIPSDGMRDLPDVSFTSAGHDPYLICLDGSCTAVNNEIYFAGISGTSAATPSFAGIMALVVQSTGSRQGQAVSKLYSLAGSESYSFCDSSDGTGSSTCVFNDVRVGNNAVPGESGYGKTNAAYQATTGYDLATGLGSVNVANLIARWSLSGSTPSIVPRFRAYVDSPSSSESLVGQTVFRGWALADAGTVTNVSVAVDSVPYGAANYGLARTDVCAIYTSANCPKVGWTMPFDTTLLPSGTHALDVTISTSAGQVYTLSSSFTTANWSSSNPIRAFIDTPAPSNGAFSGTAQFRGWAFDDYASISGVNVTIDGAQYGFAQYGVTRTDVCAAYPGKSGCPNVGWTFSLDTTQLPDGTHTIAITAAGTDGQHATVTGTFTVLNYPSNAITLFLDSPNTQNNAFTGMTNLYGWGIGSEVPVTGVAVEIDGISRGNAAYGASRPDVCLAYPNRPNCPNVGWSFPLDTMQYVNGYHLLTITGTTGTGQSAKITEGFYIVNPKNSSDVLVGIDSPIATNSIVQGSTVFNGWAISASANVTNVSLSIDSVAYGNAIYGTSRPDVCTVYPGQIGCPNVGWTLPVDTTQLGNGSHDLSVVVTTAAGQTTLSSRFTVANWSTSNPMRGFVDTPDAGGNPLTGTVELRGWILDELAPIAKVAITVDGVPFGNAAYGQTRTDVCSVFPNALGCPGVGWTYFLDTTLLSDGQHTLGITGTTAGGQSSTLSSTFQVANGGTNSVLAYIDTPMQGDGITGAVPLRGWAIDKSGAQIVSVVVLVDGSLEGLTDYGASRTDVCAVYPTAGSCPNVGWTYQLDSSKYANGTHSLEIRALSATGELHTISQEVSIQNAPYL